VISSGSAIFCYDAKGNRSQKIAGSTTTSYTYDAENRMTAVSGAAAATFVYDGDGNRVKGVVGGVTTTYIGNYFEWSPSGKTTLRVQAGSTTTMKKYYYAGGTRVAERKGTTLYWLLSDHLGSTSITATSSGSKTAELRYKAWGETRYTYGTTQTTIRYTGQREESSLGLYWYASRWYSPGLGRFVSPDTIIPQPGNPQAWDRYAYTYSNPVRYVDPSGHMLDDGCNSSGCTGDPNAIIHTIYMGGFPAIPRPNLVNFAEKAENSYDPQGRLDPSAGVSLVNDLMEQVMIYKYGHDSNEIYAYLMYEEGEGDSISITTIELWNKSNRHVSIGNVLISAYRNPCNLSGDPDFEYMVTTPRIGKSHSGLGVVAPNDKRDIPLTPSGDQNPKNLYEGSYSITISAIFYMYFPQYDTNYLYRSLTVMLDQ